MAWTTEFLLPRLAGGALLTSVLAMVLANLWALPGFWRHAGGSPDERKIWHTPELKEIAEQQKPLLLVVVGEVFDVSSGKDFYGQGQAYNCFAGRDATRAMAKLSFEEEHLNNPNSDDLNALEKSNLDDWYEKFKYYKGYPVRGKVSIPPEPKPFSLTELATYKGDQEVLPTRVDAAIYLGIKGKVIDVSYGGKEMYGKGGPYHIFAGIDASVALAKMSFDEKDLNDRDTSLLTSDQLKVLDDWEKKFLNARCYPVVGFIAS